MKVKGLTETQLTDIVNQISTTLYADNLVFNRYPERVGNFLHFTLRVNSSSGKGARRSHAGRRMVSACWHAHKDVMQLLFNRYPDALLVSAMARYAGKTDFQYNFESTGNSNIGSMIQPCNMIDACDCE